MSEKQSISCEMWAEVVLLLGSQGCLGQGVWCAGGMLERPRYQLYASRLENWRPPASLKCPISCSLPSRVGFRYRIDRGQHAPFHSPPRTPAALRMVRMLTESVLQWLPRPLHVAKRPAW